VSAAQHFPRTFTRATGLSGFILAAAGVEPTDRAAALRPAQQRVRALVGPAAWAEAMAFPAHDIRRELILTRAMADANRNGRPLTPSEALAAASLRPLGRASAPAGAAAAALRTQPPAVDEEAALRARAAASGMDVETRRAAEARVNASIAADKARIGLEARRAGIDPELLAAQIRMGAR
jgi:hypothetical protein